MPGIDITTPVTNPAFVAALNALEAADTPDPRVQVALQIGQATFLVAIMGDALHFAPGAAPGQTTLEAGSKFGVLQSDDGQGGQVLPLFTDWDALRNAITRPVSALVMPAETMASAMSPTTLELGVTLTISPNIWLTSA